MRHRGPNALSLKSMKLYGRGKRGAMGSGEEEEEGEQVVMLQMEHDLRYRG